MGKTLPPAGVVDGELRTTNFNENFQFYPIDIILFLIFLEIDKNRSSIILALATYIIYFISYFYLITFYEGI